MPVKRKRRQSPSSSHSLAPGVSLQKPLSSTPPAPWGWVGTEVLSPDQITKEHVLATCRFAESAAYAFCPNQYQPVDAAERPEPEGAETSQEDVIIVSDDDNSVCSKASCKSNPNCLNYLGQGKWEDEAKAQKAFNKVAALGENPKERSRNPELPVGLKNLGATCYANASLQVWFRDVAFRNGVYSCQVPVTSDGKHQDSPIFQLQATFAALQMGTLGVYNPTKLVESLQLRATEQQDAQEFSKLFLSHLDAEFKKQELPALKSLITDQFEGKEVYGTECHDCRQRSETENGFLELEISFEDNSRLEACIESSLCTETLTGDNQYHCSRCNGLRDATRYTELRKLPPVLHFSLLRFVYNLSTMTRKKSKHVITFPAVLDMSKFVKHGKEQIQDHNVDPDIYELRGILLHKGPSAYHGHYEAQVFDATAQSWFQFNDESVTKIEALGDSKSHEGDAENKPAAHKVSKNNKANIRKRRRIQDSDEEPERCKAMDATQISSKDAYMLVYARRDTTSRGNPVNGTHTSDITPPPAALGVVKELNVEHESLCKAYEQREQSAKESFDKLRKHVMDIYRSWALSNSEEDSIVVSQHALESWLATHWLEPAFGAKAREENGTEPGSDLVQISVEELLCPHKLLDPAQSSDMKRIRKSASEAIRAYTRCEFVPQLTPYDVCEECVRAMFKERIYEQDHPKLVREFDLISNFPPEGEGYWISKPWLKDWKLTRPKMHVPSEGDLPPDAQPYDSHVCCEHGGLAPNTAQRRAITAEAATLLQSIFPSWIPLSANVELCEICNGLSQLSKEDRRELRKRAEDEKGQLVSLYANASISQLAVPPNVPCAVVSIQFIKSWSKWLVRPNEAPRPERIDNDKLICTHDLLAYDPNHPSFSSSFMLVKQSEWNTFSQHYPAPPAVAIEKQLDDEGRARFVHSPDVCQECHLRRLYHWETAEINIRLWGTKNPMEGKKETSSKQLITYSRKAGSRHSKRLRHVKELGERRKLTIAKSTTVKDIKVMLQEELDVPTINQKLWYQGRELDDNTATMASLEITANDSLDMQEEKEILSIDDDDVDSDDGAPTKRRREIERGFSGTLLGGQDPIPPTSSRDVSLSAESAAGDDLVAITCPACTYINSDVMATECEMCYTKF